MIQSGKAISSLVAASILATVLVATPAQASSDCDALESVLVAQIISAQTMGPISDAAAAYRVCLSKLAVSANADRYSGSSGAGAFFTAGGYYYKIITSQRTYSASRQYALKAAADYRMALLGQESSVNSMYAGSSACRSTYEGLIFHASGVGDASLAASARDAYTYCPIHRTQPLARVSIGASGSATAGQSLNATVSSKPSVSGLTFQWLRNGSPIAGQTLSSYTLQPSDAGSRVTVRATFAGSGLTSVARESSDFVNVSAPALTLTLTPVPTVTGEFKVGSRLTAAPGAWDTGVSFTYRWLRDGSPISGQTGSTYSPTTSDVGRLVSVEVTGTKSGFQSASKVSNAGTVQPLPALTLTPVPTVTGEWRVGGPITAQTGQWDEGVSLTYQWHRNGLAILRASSQSYQLQTTDVGSAISVSVTGSKSGFPSVIRTSSPSQKSWAQYPTISGQPIVGGTLVASPGTWPTDPLRPCRNTTFTYSWLRDGQAIAAGWSSSYRLTEADAGKSINVAVTSRTPNSSCSGASVLTTRSSASVSIPELPALTLSPVPVLDGPAIVGNGNQLVARTGAWDSGVRFNYRWLRNGQPMTGWDGSERYILSSQDVGQSISVVVTGSKPGYRTQERVSAPVRPTAMPSLTLTPYPVVSGSYAPGSTLTANPRVWDEGVTLTYQWTWGWDTPIPGANSLSYVVSPADVTRQIGFRVTASKAGYQSVTRQMEPIVVSGTLVLTPRPTISAPDGFEIGRTVRAVPGSWDSGVSLRYTWFRNNAPITGAYSSTYKLVEADGGQAISVRVTGEKFLHTSATVSSDSVTPRALMYFTSKPQVTISCSPAVQCRDGATARANPGTWDPGVRLSYQWYRQTVGGGITPIPGAWSSTYRLTTADADRAGRTAVWVEATGTKSGYIPMTVKSRVEYPLRAR